MSDKNGQWYADQTKQLVDRMLAQVQGLPEDRMRKRPAAEAWSVMEILCHVEEILGYWPEELERVLRNKGGDWGRGLQDERRLAAVARADQRTTEDVAAGIRRAGEIAQGKLAGLTAEDLRLEAPHRNPKFGVKPMSFLADHFIVEHLEGHIRQIDRTLAAV